MHLRRISLQSESFALCSNDRYAVIMTASTNFKYKSALCVLHCMCVSCEFLIVFNHESKYSATMQLIYILSVIRRFLHPSCRSHKTNTFVIFCLHLGCVLNFHCSLHCLRCSNCHEIKWLQGSQRALCSNCKHRLGAVVGG